ncbi:hypothetical protein [Streptomyces sp. AC558_RSS880]|nr:hypothetical protein [Streptomyces sp. AC558_RSS880]
MEDLREDRPVDLVAALCAAPDRDWVVHALALGTRHADEENPT